MRPTILLYRFSKADFTKLAKQLLPMKLRLKQVNPMDYGKPIGVFAGIKELEPVEIEEAPVKELSDPMLVFCGLGNSQLDLVLSAIRRSGIGPVPYKAILTPSNQTWNAHKLLEELKQEHAKMQQI